MSFRNLGVWRFYFCLFSGGQQRVKQLIGKLESKWEEMVDIFKEMCGTEYSRYQLNGHTMEILL